MEYSHQVDPNYIEDFLICQRVFFEDYSQVTSQLLEWLESSETTMKVNNIKIIKLLDC